jgi:putative sigma-54 modulation protein
MKATVEKKLAKLDKYFSDEAVATATLSSKRNSKFMEIMVNASGTLFRSEVEDETFQNALDKAIEALEKQIQKNKTRLAKRMRAGAFQIPQEFDAAGYEEDEETIIRTKTFPAKPMTPDEAVLQMNLLGHQFFLFANSETGTICAVYVRKDGAYGLLVPED